MTTRRIPIPRPLAAALALPLLLSLQPVQDTPPPPAEPEVVASQDLAPPISGKAEEGHFRVFANEESLIEMRHSWEGNGAFQGESVLSMGEQKIEMALRIEVDGEGRWTRMEYDAAGQEIAITREEGKAVVALDGEERGRIELKPGTLLYENYQPALWRSIVDAYDGETGGKQSLPVYFIPNAVLDVTVEGAGRVERSVGGRDLELDTYSVGLPGVDVTLWTGEGGRVVFIDVPAQHLVYVREGYEALMRSPEEDQLLSQPTHDWKLQGDVMVPMRDGVKLSTDLYLPDAEGEFPAILVRTPYKKEMGELQGKYYARRGYAFAIQDCRGRFGSEGDWRPFFNEPQDGHDTIEWLAAQSFCDGKVGMIGASYVGWVQWWAARERPEHLVTIIPNVAPPDPFFNIPYEYGAFFLTGSIWWAGVLEEEATADLSGEAMRDVNNRDYHELLRHLPVIELDEKVLGKQNAYWREWIEHPVNDEWWDGASFLDHLAGVDIPVFHQSGWFDGDGIGSKLNYAAMRGNGASHQKLVLGPWGHTDTSSRSLGNLDFGPEAVVDLQRDYLRWFDCWLKGIPNGIDDEPLVKLFVMGANRWLEGDSYPLAETELQRWYLRGGGSANTSEGNGRLSPEPPDEDEPVDRFVYDPGDPTPSPRMPIPRGDGVEEGESPDLSSYEAIVKARQDILVYRTEPLEQPLVVAGPITAILFASSSAKDTDWFVRVGKLDEEGEILPLVEGKLRARFRQSCSEPELLEPGEVYEYRIDCWQTGIEIAAGERLQVEIASASFPSFSRNLNTGGHNEKETEYVSAEQTIYHDTARASHLLLPVIPAKEEK